MSARINTQGEGESVSHPFGHFLIRCVKFYTAETGAKKKRDERENDGMKTGKRAALC